MYANAAQVLSIDGGRGSQLGTTAKKNLGYGVELSIRVSPRGFVERVELKLESEEFGRAHRYGPTQAPGSHTGGINGLLVWRRESRYQCGCPST